MQKIGLIIIAMLMTACLIPVKASGAGAYGGLVDSEIDPELTKIDEDKYLGVPVATGYSLINEEGKGFVLGDMLKGKPLIILFSYYRCDGICPTVNRDFRTIVSKMKKKRLGEDFQVLSLSFDRDDTLDRLRMFNKKLDFPEWMNKGWTTALFKNQEEIKSLTASVGYRFFWSPRDKLFLHPNVFIFLSPDGRVVRYLYGANIGSQDVELAINEAAFGKTGRSKTEDLKDLVLLACYSYNYKEGKYSINYPLFIAIGSLLLGVTSTVIGLIVIRKRVRR
ncbi:MAG: SCO family protein [Thermodesulfobacteriota bacterium]